MTRRQEYKRIAAYRVEGFTIVFVVCKDGRAFYVCEHHLRMVAGKKSVLAVPPAAKPHPCRICEELK